MKLISSTSIKAKRCKSKRRLNINILHPQYYQTFNKKVQLLIWHYSAACEVSVNSWNRQAGDYEAGTIRKTLINCLRGISRWARGTQKPRHILKYVEVMVDTPNGYELYPFGVCRRATWQFGDSPAQAINQGSLRYLQGCRSE